MGFFLIQLMLKPVEYGLTSNSVSYVGDKNLKLLATLFVYVCRQVYVPPSSKNPPVRYTLYSTSEHYIYNKWYFHFVLGGSCIKLHNATGVQCPQPVPYEIGRFLYQDDDMQPIFKKLKKSFDYSEVTAKGCIVNKFT